MMSQKNFIDENVAVARYIHHKDAIWLYFLDYFFRTLNDKLHVTENILFRNLLPALVSESSQLPDVKDAEIITVFTFSDVVNIRIFYSRAERSKLKYIILIDAF